MGEGGRRRAWKLRDAARKVAAAAAYACGFFSLSISRRKPLVDISNSSYVAPSTTKNSSAEQIIEETECSFTTKIDKNEIPNKNLCAICLDPVSYNSKGSSPGQAIFTAQCSHAFHFACISSNVRHGSVTCPICGAHWTQLPRNWNCNNLCGSSTCGNQTDPILRILDDSIATFSVHCRTLLRSTRYDDYDPVDPDNTTDSQAVFLSCSFASD